MIFPFVIKYTRHYNSSETTDELKLKRVSKELKKLKVGQIEIKENVLSYSNGLFNGQGRTHVLAPIDTGAITVEDSNDIITFQFSTMRTFYLCSAISVLAGVFSQDKLVGFGLFFWLYGLNVIISAYRLPHLVKQLLNALK